MKVPCPGNIFESRSARISLRLMFIILVLMGIISFYFLTRSLEKELKEVESPAMPVVAGKAPVKKRIDPGPVSRKTMWDPSRKYAVSIFSAGDDPIAGYKSLYGNIYDLTGTIPDGEVKFTDQTRDSSGREHYLNGKLDGEFIEYFSSGQLRRKSRYEKGKVMTNKEYFVDGTLRIEEDFTDAMWITNNKEVGAGKVYARDGTLKYEWSLTNSQGGGYNRSYDSQGNLVDENFFDQNGQLIKKDNLNAGTP